VLPRLQLAHRGDRHTETVCLVPCMCWLPAEQTLLCAHC